MANSKSLTQLADEYSKSLQSIEQQIILCREKIANEQKLGHNLAIGELTRKLTVLYDLKNELAEVESHLRNYYNKEMRYAC